MNLHKNVHSFRPPSRDPRQISERCIVCENPPKRFVFAQMTIGLEECFKRIRNEDENIESNLLENETINEEVFTPSQGSILAGRYKVIAKVGEGQSSILVKAKDTFHPEKRYVAIKILHASYRNLGPQEASCLLHLKRADTLKVANIAHVLNTFTIGQHFCIVFEFLSPTPLYKYFQTFPFPSKVGKTNLIRKIAFQVTQCLAVLSSLNIIHADIKPENILFANGKNRDVKIIDFGNAIYWVHDEMSLYFGSFELQTVFYRAPEVMFGLPFGPQIDMWSLGCVLAELYLGEPLFLATSKDEILEKMQALLGPLPMVPFQSGKYFSTFKKFVGRTSTVPGYSKNVVNILKKLGSTDYMFADFLARLLTFDPRLRLSPVEAACHPFLAPVCPLGFISPPGNSTQECGYSPILLTPATYPFRPKIDEKIKQRHYSELDFLRAGTQARTVDENVGDNVMKVLPYNYYQEESISSKDNGQHCNVENKKKTEANDSSIMAANDGVCKDETPVVHGVSNGMNCRDKLSVTQDRRENAFHESCSVLHATNDRRSFLVEENQSDNADGKSCSVINRKPCSVNGGQTDAFKEPYRHSSSNKDSCASTRFVDQDQRDNTFNESCSIINTIKEQRSAAGCVNEGKRDAFNESYSLSKKTKEDRRNDAFNESCSVLNTLKEPRCFSNAESHKKRGRKEKRTHKLFLLKSSKTRRRRHEGEETESRSSVSTDDISEDSTDYRKSYAGWNKSPAKFNYDVLSDVPEPGDITRTTSEAFDGKKTDHATTHDVFFDDKGKDATGESIVESTNVAQLSLNEEGDEHPIVTKCQSIGHARTGLTKSSAQSHGGQPLFMPAVNEYKDQIEISNESGSAGNQIIGFDESGDQSNIINNEYEDYEEIVFIEYGNQENIMSESGNQRKSRKNTKKPETNEKERTVELRPMSGSRSKTGSKDAPKDTPKTGIKDAPKDTPKTGTKDAPKDTPKTGTKNAPKDTPKTATKDAPKDTPNVVASSAGRRTIESTKQARLSKAKDDLQTEPNLLPMIIRKDVTTASDLGNYQDERTGNSPSEVNFFKANSNEVSSTAGSSQCHKVQETVTKPHIRNKKSKSLTYSNSQVFSDGEETGCVTSSIKKGQFLIQSNCNAKESMLSKSSSIESFFDNWDAFSDDETSLVSSSVKPRGLWTKKPAKSSSTRTFSKGKNSSSNVESKLVTSSKEQDRLPPTASTKSSNFQSFSEHGKATSNEESKLATSCVKEGNKSNSNVSSVGNKKEPRTPNVQRKESVFDTPASVVTSTCELLPGGLSEVKKAICQSAQDHDNLNTLQEIHNIFQEASGGSSQKVSKGKRNDKTSGKTRKAHKSDKNTSARGTIGKVSSERNTRCDEKISCGVFRNEPQNSQVVANEKPGTNSPTQLEFLATDFLKQDVMKPPRKRKLSYKLGNSPNQTMSCLTNLRERQAAKVQKLSDAELNDEYFHEVTTLEDDSEKPSRSENDKYPQKRDTAKKKEKAKQSEEVRDLSIAKNTFERFAEEDWSVENCLCRNSSLSSVKEVRDLSPSIAKNTFQRFAEEEDWSVEDCLCRNSSLSSVKETDIERGKDMFVNKKSRSSETENKQCFTRTSQSSIFNEEYEDYDVLLL